MTSIDAQFDHVVVLVPYKDVIDPPEWLTHHFTISPGGRHGDNKTENRLILLGDGTYIEIIAFIDDKPENRQGHHWDKPFGVVDFALTTSDEAFPELDGVKHRLAETDTGISYSAPQEGGRHRPDGVELQWRVTFPKGCERGEAPFWCHDVTPRKNRVPITDANTSHPSGVISIAGVELQATSHARLATATAAILDTEVQKSGEYGVGVPHRVAQAKQPSIRINSEAGYGKDLSLTLILQTTRNLPPIHEKLGNGTVSLVFEQPS